MTDTDDEGVLTIHASGRGTRTVIFLHGLGQQNGFWESLLQAVANKVPSIEWLIPQAKLKPVTWSDGQMRPSWFDIENLPPHESEFDERGISESISTIENLILNKVHSGMDSKDIILAGFSQGAALSMMVALTTLHELGGVACLSGWIPHRVRDMIYTEPILPIFWAHGKMDDEIPMDYATESIDFLQSKLGIAEHAIRFIQYEGLKHEVDDQEMEDFARWLSDLQH